jgi:oxygen-independent coproporphyrinogen-3 oxidase
MSWYPDSGPFSRDEGPASPKHGPESGNEAGLYVHVPFCRSVCPYCDFSVVIAGEERRQGFLRALEREAEAYSDRGLVFGTVYLGGGTPSSLEAEQLGGMVGAIRDRLEVDPGSRWYLEVNPEDVSPASARAWRELGFGTVSLGVQSFDDGVLRLLGRRHSAADARKALERLQAECFETVSVDLIYGLDGQSATHWARQLDEAVERGADHLSCYQLTFHDGTVFGRRLARGELHELPDDDQAGLFVLTHSRLADAGYDGYEVSNFAARPEHQSRHNMKYWRHVPYLGLGPSAHSFVDGTRWWNRRKARLWQRELDAGGLPVEGSERLTAIQMAAEAVMLGLRTRRGVDLEAVRGRFGIDLLGPNAATIECLHADGFVVLDGAMLRPTLSGMAIADTLARSIEVTTATAGRS